MSKVEKFSIALTPELAEMVREAVRTGQYASSSEVIRDALRGWLDERRPLHPYTIAELRQLVDEGLASGFSEHYRTAAEISADGRRRLAKLNE
jgi:antitoxin ParD1/3/4